MRTIQELVNEIKQLDNDTQITVSAIRRLVKENKIKSVRIGNKTLINLDYCIDYLNNPVDISGTYEKDTQNIDTIKGIDRIEQYKRSIRVK
jgi:hypothetical protein